MHRLPLGHRTPPVLWALLCVPAACQPDAASDPDNREQPPSATQLFGGQTSDGTGFTGDDAANLGDQCDVSSTAEPLEFMTSPKELGFSALDVARWVAVGVDSSLTWAPDGDFTTAPESGDGQLSIDFEVASDSARLYFPESSENGEPPPAACGPWIEVDAVATLVTDGGALDEQFPVQLRAARPGVVAFRGSLSRGDLEGELQVSSVSENALQDTLTVSGTVTAYGSYGIMTVRPIEDNSPPNAVLRWPSLSDCPRDGALRFTGDDTLFGLEVEQLRQAYAAIDALPLSWTDGERSRADLSARPETPLCIATVWWGELSFAFVATTLSVVSEDQQWDATYPSFLRLYGDEDRDPVALLEVDLELPGARRHELGLSALTAEPTESVRLVLDLERTLPEGAPSGKLKVTGDSDAHCSELPDDEVDPCLVENQDIELVGAELGL